MERKLTAILSADVKGYSRLMGEDEEATIRTLTAYRAVMTTCIQQQRGRVVDSPGDNLLAEFASLRKRYWGQHLWARGYWVASSGNVTDEVWAEYIKNQSAPEPDDAFNVT